MFSEMGKLILDNGIRGATMSLSPPILVRIEWADSQGNVTASWLAAHFRFRAFWRGVLALFPKIVTTN